MPLSKDEARQLARIETELGRADRRLKRTMQSFDAADPRLTRTSLLTTAVALGLFAVGAMTAMPQAYIAAWFLFLLAMVLRCAAHLVRTSIKPETLE